MARLGKHVLAAYYNDARVNILLCLNAIREKRGFAPHTDDAQIVSAYHDLKLCDQLIEEQQQLEALLRKRFPLLNPITDKKKKHRDIEAERTFPVACDRFLIFCFERVNAFRNAMVHPTDPEDTMSPSDQKWFSYLIHLLYDSSRREVKKRFGHDKHTMEPLLYKGKGKKHKTIRQFSIALTNNPYDVKDLGSRVPSEFVYDFGHVFFCSLFLDRTQSAELINYFWQTRPEHDWTEQQRKILHEMIAVYRCRLPVQRLQSDDSPTAVTLDALQYLARCPKALFNQIAPDDQQPYRITMQETEQGIEEQSTDPTPLFVRGSWTRHIPLIMRLLDLMPANRLRFAIDLGYYYHTVRIKTGEHFTDEEPRVRRLGQRLVGYGKLQFFEQGSKPAIWTHLLANQQRTAEQVRQSLSGFSESHLSLKPYLVQTRPRYHFQHDQIGFRLDDTESVNQFPDIPLSNEEDQDSVMPVKKQTMSPEFVISPNQLLHFAFYLYLTSEKKTPGQLPLEILLKRFKSGMSRLVDTIASGGPALDGDPGSKEREQCIHQWLEEIFSSDIRFQPVPMSALPKVVIAHLRGKSREKLDVDSIKARCQTMIDETDKRLRQIKYQSASDARRGQKKFSVLNCGQIGEFISSDLLRFQPINTSRSDGGKLTSQQYQILQAAFAYFGAHVGNPPMKVPELISLLNDCRLINHEFAHPFLHKLGLEKNKKQHIGLVSFYKDYLLQRKIFIEKYLYNLNKTKDEKNTTSQGNTGNETDAGGLPKWLRLRNPSSIDTWLNNFRDTNGSLYNDEGKINIHLAPLVVPRDFLYTPILHSVSELLDCEVDQLIEDGTQTYKRTKDNDTVSVDSRPAISWMIKQYFQSQGDSELPAMYALERQHAMFDDFLDDRGKKNRFEEKPQRYLSEGERKNLLDQIRAHVAKGPSDDERLVKRKKQLAMYKRSERQLRYLISWDRCLYLLMRGYLEELLGTGVTPNLSKLDRTVLNNTIKHEVPIPDTEYTLFHPALKIRLVGEMRMLARDRRLSTLACYYPSSMTQLHMLEIKSELQSYRRSRVQLMDTIQRFEHALQGQLGSIPEKTKSHMNAYNFGNGRHGDFLFAYHEWCERERLNTFTATDLALVLGVRNAFAHNQYPKLADTLNHSILSTVVQQVASEPVPHNNPTQHRKVASRLLEKTDQLYRGWIQTLQTQTADTTA